MKRYIATGMILIATLIGVAYSPSVSAYNAFSKCTSNNSGQCGMLNETKLSDANGVWKLIQQALYALGGIAVIMIVIGGIKYASSQGDSSQISSAKNTILFSVIGLIVALSAALIIGWVTSYFS